MKLPCLHLSWQQDLVTQRINLGSSSWVQCMSYHGHWDLPKSTHCHLCTAVTEALGTLLLYPSSWVSNTKQPFQDPSQRLKDFSRKHILSLFRKHQWVLQRVILASPFFSRSPLRCSWSINWSGVLPRQFIYTVRSNLAFRRKSSALEDLHCPWRWKIWIWTLGFRQCLMCNN